MSDDQVKNAIAELQDDVRCRCHPAYKDRGLHDPDCNCDNAGAVQVVADRIAELEAKLVEYKMIAGAIDKRWAESEDEVAELQANLAKALAALDGVMVGGNHLAVWLPYDHPTAETEPQVALEQIGAGVSYDVWCCWRSIMKARNTIAELKGESDGQA